MVKVIERFVIKAPHDGQPSVFGGTVLETLSNGQVVESQLAIVPVEELSQWIPSLNAQLLIENQALTAERDSLQSQLIAMKTERDTALSEKAGLQTQLDSANATIETLQARIYELENPPNPFPNSDWQGFRSAALASPVIMRMAVSNIGNFMMLLIYLTEMQKDPATSAKMVGVWNEMETRTPLSPEEIAGINALAAQYQVPMVLNSEGQIV